MQMAFRGLPDLAESVASWSRHNSCWVLGKMGLTWTCNCFVPGLMQCALMTMRSEEGHLTTAQEPSDAVSAGSPDGGRFPAKGA